MSSSFLVLEGGKTVTNLAFAREVSPFLFGESVCSAVSGLALGDLSGSLPVKNSAKSFVICKIMPASPAIAVGYTEIYVAVLSIIASKCATVDPQETELVAACSKFKEGVIHLKTYVSALNEILPVSADLTPLPNVPTIAPDSNSQLSAEILRGYQLLKGGDKWHTTSFEDDTLTQSFYSPLHRALIDRVLADEEEVPDTFMQLLSLGFNTLAQIRATRYQMGEQQYMLKWTLAACLIPQLTLLLLLGIQWIVNRRRQTKLRKQIKKAEDAHQMIARIRGNHTWREQGRFVEV